MDGFDNEVLKNIQQTAVQAAGAKDKVQIVTLGREPDHIYGIVTPDGKVDIREATPAPRCHTLISLAEAVLYANEMGDPARSVIWFDRSGVVILLDDATRRDMARLSLKLTPQFAALAHIESTKKLFEQKEFRRFLKIDMAGCLRDSVLVNWVSDMEWDSSGKTQGRFTSQSESLGRDISQQAMSTLGECPEEISIDVRIFDDPALLKTSEIRCSVEVLPAEQRFRLLPLPLRLHDAIEVEIGTLGEELRKSTKLKVFRGCP